MNRRKRWSWRNSLCRCCRRRRGWNGCRDFAAFRRDRPVEDSVARDEEVGPVGGVDGLECVDGHLVEGHVHLLRLLHNHGSGWHPEEDRILKKCDEIRSTLITDESYSHKIIFNICNTQIAKGEITSKWISYFDVEEFSSGDFESANGDVSEGRVPEPGLLHVDGLQLEGVHHVDPDEVKQLNVVEVKLKFLPILKQIKRAWNFWANVSI